MKSIQERRDRTEALIRGAAPAAGRAPDAEEAPGAAARAAKRPGKLARALAKLPPELPIFLLYALLAVYLTWPVIKGFNHYFYGFPSDNLGAMWTWWWYRKAGSFGATASFCPIIGYPFGQALAPWTGEIVLDLSVRFMLLFAPQTVVYNLIITSSFALSGVTMYYLARYVTGDRRVAFFGGLAYVVGAFHAIHSMMFANLAMVQWMPLYILALLVFVRNATWRNAALLLLAALLVTGTSIHYGLFMAVFTVAFLAGRFAYLRIRRARLAGAGLAPGKEPVAFNSRTAAMSLLVVALVVGVVFPLFLSSYGRGSLTGNWPTRTTPGSKRTIETDRGGSASPLAYVLPEKENFLLGPITRKIASGRVNTYENSLYLGLTVMGLAAVALATAIGRGRKKKKTGVSPPDTCPDGPGEGAERPATGPAGGEAGYRAMVWGLVTAAAVGFVLSMPPYLNVGSARIPLPSMLVHYTVPWIRWYLRFGVIVVICFILLACLGLRHMLRRSGGAVASSALALLSVFLFLEMTVVPPARYFTISSTPPGIFGRLADMDVGALVVYPAFEPGFFNAQQYLLFQQQHGKPMLNGGMDNSDGEALRRTVYNPFNPQTPSILSRFGITHVVYLDRMFEEYEGTEKADKEVGFLPPGLEPLARVGGDDYFGNGRVYRVTAPSADVVPIYQGDITVPHIDTGRITVRLMENLGKIRLVNYSGGELVASVRIPLSNVVFPHEVTVSAGRSVLWRGGLTGEQATVVDLPGLRIPEGGLVLDVSVTGTRLVLSAGEVEVYGASYATLRVGDVRVETGEPRSGGDA